AITFGPRTDMAYALQLVRARVSQIQGTLPPDLDIDIERLTPSLFPIISYNLEGGDPATLYDIARYEIKPLISRVPGVGRVDVQGTDVREIEVIADPPRLAALGLTYADLADAIRRAVTVQAVGRVAQDYRQYLIVTDQEAHGPEDIGNVVIRSGLRVRDVAGVQVGTEDHVRIVAGDGRPAALINVARQVEGNALAGADSVAGDGAALARGHGHRDRPRDRRCRRGHGEHRAPSAARPRQPTRRHPRRRAGADLARHDVDGHHRGRVPAAGPAAGRGGAVLRRPRWDADGG